MPYSPATLVQTSCCGCTGGSFNGAIADGVWSWPLDPIWCRVSESVALYLHSLIRLHVLLRYDCTFTFNKGPLNRNKNFNTFWERL